MQKQIFSVYLHSHYSNVLQILGSLAQLVQSIPISSGGLGFSKIKNILGRLAQLVQSTSFTPRGSGVRTPHRPQTKKHFERSAFFYSISNVFSNAIPREPLIKIKLFEGIFDFKKPEKSSKVLKNFK